MRGMCSLPCCIQHRNFCLILFLTVRFTLWTNKGNAIISATGTATFYFKKNLLGGGGLFLGRENSRATPPLYEALIGMSV